MVALGNAVAPAILGTAMNSTYGKKLEKLLPAELERHIDTANLESLADPRVLMSKDAMKELQNTFNKIEGQGPDIDSHIQEMNPAVRQSGKLILAFLLILTIPESMDVEVAGQDQLFTFEHCYSFTAQQKTNLATYIKNQ